MKSNFQAKKPFLLIFLVLGIICSSFNGKSLHSVSNFRQTLLVDTVPVAVIHDSTSVYIEAQYPGGNQAWTRYLCKTFRYPPYAFANYIQGSVTVTFLVDEKGRVKNLDAFGPEELRKEAMRVVGSSGRWTPATTNGIVIRSEKKQTVTFKME